jgi:hypothetical protein
LLQAAVGERSSLARGGTVVSQRTSTRTRRRFRPR